ncbi:hypothetical protein DVH05_009827 [Phytophthora capsici]|nr:hypothetical protein DVH05_009827 [Phytophthora capsici]
MPPPSLQHRGNPALRKTRREPNSLESTPTFSESKLVLAIQTLDSTWKTTKSLINEEESVQRSPPLSDPLREALCTLLEIAACFDNSDPGKKSQLKTVCTARVLGCLKRFVTGYGDVQSSLGACCDRKCERRLVDIALLNILFRMCREPEIAGNVVKESLHTFILKMCATSEMQTSILKLDLEPKEDEVPDKMSFDPLDLMITIDPFDWCYQPLCRRLLNENTHTFFIPVGIRSLIYLLRGLPVPTDEVSELQEQPHKNPKHRKLPSIFTFSKTEEPKEHASGIKTNQFKLPPLCCEQVSPHTEQREIRAMWSLILADSARTHLALRSLVALGVHLPRRSSEYKSLKREGGCILMKCNFEAPTYENGLKWLNHNSPHVKLELLPFQPIATQRSTLKRIASAASLLFTEEEPPKFRSKQTRTLNPIKKSELTKQNGASLSIQQRLRVASENAHSELANWETRHLSHQASQIERTHQRFAIQQMCGNIESLRGHLVTSLGVLCSGRRHPDPTQPFSEWIRSLPTLETLEKERQYQQEMRQRQILEQQYLKEAQRRHERDECLFMQANDHNVPEENELTKQLQKQQHFLEMQAEIRQLEQNDSSRASLDTASAMKEKRANEERQRMIQLENERRERRELEKMRREDFYYVERILLAKAKAKEEDEKREKTRELQKNLLEEQQKKIARMRLLDEEKRLAERETNRMQLEDLLGRQRRFRDVEKAKEQVQNEWRELKTMRAEEHECKSRWTLWDRALLQQQQEEQKRQRAETRRLRRQQQREENEMKAAWVESWDHEGNKYFYNSISGESQWGSPF